MKIGRRIFYDSQGLITANTGERIGNVKETTIEKDRIRYNVSDLDNVIELEYNERNEEIKNRGSWEVVDNNLVIYPKVTIQSDKEAILNDGIDTAIITATVSEDMTLVFTVFETDYSVNTVNGVGSLEVTTTVIGEIFVGVSAGKYGKNSIIIKGVDSIA